MLPKKYIFLYGCGECRSAIETGNGLDQTLRPAPDYRHRPMTVFEDDEPTQKAGVIILTCFVDPLRPWLALGFLRRDN